MKKEQLKPDSYHTSRTEKELTQDILKSRDREIKEDVDRMGDEGGS